MTDFIKTMETSDAEAVKAEFDKGIEKLIELLARPTNTVAIVVVSDGKSISSGCAGSVVDISTVLGPGFDIIANTVKQAVGNHNG